MPWSLSTQLNIVKMIVLVETSDNWWIYGQQKLTACSAALYSQDLKDYSVLGYNSNIQMRFALDIAGFVSYSNIITIITLFEWYGLSDASCSLSVLSEWKIMMILRVWDNGLLIITMLIEIIILLALLQYWLLTQHLTWICEATLRWSPLLNNVWPLILRSEMRISFLVQGPLSDDPTTIILTRSQH